MSVQNESLSRISIATASPNWDDPLAAAIPSQVHAPIEFVSEERNEPITELELAALPPVRLEDKRVVNGEADVNQLAPFKYPWAWNFFLNATIY